MKALVTGSSGFVGVHMVAALEGWGYEVSTCDIEQGADALELFRLQPEFKVDLAIHCAAFVGGRVGIDGSPLRMATNLALDAWFFRWLQTSGTKRAVYFSSSAAYPVDLQTADPRRLLVESDIDLTNVRQPDSIYGWAKVTGERLAQEAEAAGINVLVLRPFSGYGASQSLDYPMASFIDRAVRRADPFDIWGDGTQVRDWIHIDDIVGGVMAAIENDVLGPVNLGTGIGTSMMELAKMCITQADHVVARLNTRPDKPSGVQYRVADPTLLHTFYTPKVSLEEGISRALSTPARTQSPAPR